MTAGPSGTPGPTPSRGALSPEGVGGLLAVGVVILAIVALIGPAGSATSGTVSGSPSPAPTSAGSSAGRSPGADASRPPGPTPTPIAWAPEAAALMLADEEVMERRDRLAAVDRDMPTSEIATQLRAMNSALNFSMTVVDRLDRAGAPRALVTDTRQAHQAILDETFDTLDASIQDRGAFVDGAAQVVVLTAELEAVLVRSGRPRACRRRPRRPGPTRPTRPRGSP